MVRNFKWAKFVMIMIFDIFNGPYVRVGLGLHVDRVEARLYSECEGGQM